VNGKELFTVVPTLATVRVRVTVSVSPGCSGRGRLLVEENDPVMFSGRLEKDTL